MRALALGAYHSCLLLASGRVACFGDNTSGQLGTSALERSSAPLLVEGLSDVVELHASYDATCARIASGDIACWGANSHGQADPRPVAEAARNATHAAHDRVKEPDDVVARRIQRTPSVLPLGAKAQSFALGMAHGCAVLQSGAVACWGDDAAGQLGVGAEGSVFGPKRVEGLPPVVEVAAGGDSSCARTASGDVFCWGGHNAHAELGTRQGGPAVRQVPGVSGALALTVSVGRACARVAGDRWWCWGDSGGCGDTQSQQPPALAADLGEARQVVRAHGGCFWCALRPSGAVECMDKTDGSTSTKLNGASAVAAGNEHACAIFRDGEVQCWGKNVRGELGRDTPELEDPAPGRVEWRPSLPAASPADAYTGFM